MTVMRISVRCLGQSRGITAVLGSLKHTQPLDYTAKNVHDAIMGFQRVKLA